MISEIDMRRIKEDAYIAMDSLEGIYICSREGRLDEHYLEEKVETVQRCLNFMKHFYKEK